MSDEFEAAIEEAKRLEKKQVEYSPYSGDINLERTLDLEPRDYVDLRYPDLLNLYERSQKIISTTSMGILAAGTEGAEAAVPEIKVETDDVENKLREMTNETLRAAEEVAKEPMAVERQPESQIEFEKHDETPKAQPQAVEFESRTTQQQAVEMEKEAPKAPEMPPSVSEKPEQPAAREPPEAKISEPAAAPMAEVPAERKMIVAAVPPALRESPDKAAGTRYEKMEEQIRAAVGDKVDEMTLKKKMLELTKQLFKEKTTSKREEIKLQITVLKNMLSGVQVGGGKAAAGTKKTAGGADADTHIKLFDTMLSTQQVELAQTKDSIIDSYNKQVAEIKKKFYEQIAMTDDASERKKNFEAFVFSVESLVEQLPEVMRKYREFTAKKHAAEMEKLRNSLGGTETDTRSKVERRLDYINNKYDQEFASVKGIVGRQIENLIEVAGTEIFKQQDEKPMESESKVYETVKEINETDEGTLLYFLHSKDPEQYKKYERKQVSKAEAIFKAKELMAKDKGLNESTVKKYFSQTEG
ncbi:MAG: hypothetical protein V1861_06565 [Candidatus Micrarchaeota archaeon]